MGRKRSCFYIFMTSLCITMYLTFDANKTEVKKILKARPDLGRNFYQSSYATYRVSAANFARMKFGPIYILGAAGGNSSDNEVWDIFKIYANVGVGSGVSSHTNVRVSCCFRYNVGNVTARLKEPTLITKVPEARTAITACHYTCNNPKHGLIPDGVGLTVGERGCDEKYITYVRPFMPVRKQDITLAISTKAAYGNVSAEMIIEWMETYKYLGVDKVVTSYLYDINADALKVLKYYASTGILDLSFFDPAAADGVPRINRHEFRQFWNDKQLIMFDHFERMSGYTCFGIIDHDEFLIPSRNRSLKQMLADLYSQYPKAAGFVFKSQYFFLSWGETGDVSDLILGSYVNRTAFGPQIDSEKNIYKPKYVSHGAVTTHKIKPVDGFEMHIAPSEEGFIRHFRPCRKHEYTKVEEHCLHDYKRVTDTSVAQWSENIRKNVEYVRQQVFGTTTRIL